jgi:hypothetical protein
MKTYGGVGVQVHTNRHFLQVSSQLHAPTALPGQRAPGTHGTGGRANPRAGLDNMEKLKFLTLPGLELRNLSLPARSQSLYRLRYCGSTTSWAATQTKYFYPCNRTWRPIELWDIEAPKFSRQLLHRWRWYQPYAPSTLYSRKITAAC